MFGFDSGTTGIDNAIASFERLANAIERGVEKCQAKRVANYQRIGALCDDNTLLDNAIDRGESVARKLRELVS